MRWALLLLLSGCWGYPTLGITARGDQFTFARCGRPGPPPPLQSIAVYLVDASGQAREPPVCRSELRAGSGTAPVGGWVYGSDLPSLVTRACARLEPGRRYLISIAGGGQGSAFFTVFQGGIGVEGAPCR
jgi:hypothetical protein